MPRTFETAVDSPATVAQIVSAFSDERYWSARLGQFAGGTAAVESLRTDATGTVAVTIALGLLRDRLPKVVTQLHPGDIEMIREERWCWLEDGRVRGDIEVTVTGAPVCAAGQCMLTSTATGSRMTYAGSVKVNVPLVGGRIESYMGRQTVDEIARLQEFTNDWIAENHRLSWP
ncbi:DUF2505 domain-containing protein [Mycolicibacterium monacense]|uniref:DUF2505 domain-containing protein n=4 Tax=Mycobacteriaceae TaxID=1762 RepID=A0AAD1IXU5_MYCMB|nr:DUF2505 domain-containing protein [Mycolicibacterium monacense]MDA4101724.1 hypothetical protein [Mycolicibacterium monacense DSM 44395]OBB62274.1 hypothetical protein A6B34_26620 [Mycolicibacterium monacense]OBF47210.1 hypothetical protein A5778_25055 [Mycolicibacterium monacense]ORB13751.1 hypothetical protein BST34_24320 [Mycolicibacterium monacense DSM 44395]QHP86546.1 DUF2505 domain-containing protein [Mycolicibacterium monacense DSM 44395]